MAESTADYYRQRANEARAMAADMRGDARQTMLEIAESYDVLAAQADRQKQRDM